MDEIDTAFPSREAMGGSESDRRLVSTLLSLLDGCCANSVTGTVIVIACTNQPQVSSTPYLTMVWFDLSRAPSPNDAILLRV